MTTALPEDLGATLQKGLSEWWSEETEYVFQRIERWAAFARGYNRLRSQRLSRGRLTMQEEQEPRWRISSNKLVIDDNSWSPRFKSRSRRKSRPEELRINCCGRFNYQSSSNLDSTCLETYRYDHSIYFKTIGDLKSSKRDLSAKPEDQHEDTASISSEEMVEWDVEAASEFIANHFGLQLPKSHSIGSTSPTDDLDQVPWPVVDFSNLQLSSQLTECVVEPAAQEVRKNETNREKCFEMMRQESEEESHRGNNNNYIDQYREDGEGVPESQVELSRLNNNAEHSNTAQIDNRESLRNQEQAKRYFTILGSRRSSRDTNQPSLLIDSDVGWTDILLNPTDNVDPPTYSL